jgi:hypothetical protein
LSWSTGMARQSSSLKDGGHPIKGTRQFVHR